MTKEDFMDIEDLKCCGNCKFRLRMDIGNCYESWCGNKKHNDESIGDNEYCNDWEFDNLKKNDRII